MPLLLLLLLVKRARSSKVHAFIVNCTCVCVCVCVRAQTHLYPLFVHYICKRPGTHTHTHTQVHAFIVHYIRKQIAGWATVTVWDKGAKQRELVENLEKNLPMCAQRYGLALGDFPNCARMKAKMLDIKDMREIPRLNKNLVADLEKMLQTEIPQLLERSVIRHGSSTSRRFLD